MGEREALTQIIGKHILLHREKLNLTQDEVGELVGISGKHIGRLESAEKLANCCTLTNHSK